MEKHVAIDPKSLPLPVTIAPDSVTAVAETVAAVTVKPGDRVQSQAVDPSVPATTTFQDDLVTASQRRVNLIWESTQSAIALMVVISCMVVGVAQGLGSEQEFPMILSSSLFLVIGFYFSRVNHSAIGGVGRKPPEQPYTGR